MCQSGNDGQVIFFVARALFNGDGDICRSPLSLKRTAYIYGLAMLSIGVYVDIAVILQAE
jgi:hypothetical protein